MTLPETLRLMYSDGTMSTDYLMHCDPAQVPGLAPALVAAAEYIPHQARQAYFCGLAGPALTQPEPETGAPIAERIEADATANPETVGDLNADAEHQPTVAGIDAMRKKWPLGLQEEAKSLVLRVLAKPDMTAEGLQWDAEIVAFAAIARSNAETVIAKAVARGAVLTGGEKPEPEPAIEPEPAADTDNEIIGPANWAAILPDGTTHRVERSCCRWFVVRPTDDDDSHVIDIARTRSEAVARVDVLSPRYPSSVWTIVEANQDLAAELAAETETALLVTPDTVATVDEILAMVGPDPLTVPSPEPVAVPIYSWEQFNAEVQETVIAEGIPGPFQIDTVDRLGWFVRKLAGIDGEMAALDASYQAAKKAIANRRASYERYFTPQAQAFAAEELTRIGGGKTLRVLGGSAAFRSVDDRLDRVDADAALAWARAELPAAIVQKITESVAAKSVEIHWKTTGEVPPGYEKIPAHEAFSVTPAKKEA